MYRLIALFALLLTVHPVMATEAGWALLRDGGQVVLLNSAATNGTSEPANFDIEVCSTQRNLSARGRQQAKRIGALIFARAAPVEEVVTSSHCRSRDTGFLAFGDEDIEIWPALNNSEPESAAAEENVAAIKERIDAYSGSGNLFLITQEQVIQALTGARVRDGEALILSRGAEQLSVAARIRFN
ncbi:histidine phosphatase [Nitratireductor basaltis]|uniref:Phosphoglycerate mutase n=1 Tax=Nitratireductor basaltis TaxID=472175 RepID=A0A084UA24_9HYPH|nr:histidine phosphatase [Nitratireductor basaltis]KFB09810.1 Phosphoglycerate mutase [Nitratireductor basaltis]